MILAAILAPKPLKLPKSIDPCPIKEAICEVRFESNVPADAVFGIVYQVLGKDFSESIRLPILNIPAELRNADKDLAFQAHYRLEQENIVILIGPRMMAVGMLKTYPGWTEHARSIKALMGRFESAGIVRRIERLGLRYISFFPYDVFPKLLLQITDGTRSLDGDETFFRTVLDRGGYKNLLQIRKGVALVRKPDEKGSIVDIDSFSTEINGAFEPALNEFLENAHRVEKELFFGLLKPEFLQSLSPTYENAN